jgi:hypothetical protein
MREAFTSAENDDIRGSPRTRPRGSARATAARRWLAAARGVDVFTAYCESHATDIPFHVVARLLRAATAVSDLDGQEAPATLRRPVPCPS